MRTWLLRALAVIHLTRLSGALAAVANVWFVILWTRETPQEPGTLALTAGPLAALLAGGAAAAIGLYAYGASLNDVLDVKRDRALRPDRPIASGRLTGELAMTLVLGSLITATLGAAVLGLSAVVLTLVVAGAVLFFNAAAKFVPAVGLVVLGLIYAGHMLVPNVNLRFLWPVWLVMTHALVTAAATHVVMQKVPRLSVRAVIAATTGWAVWSAVLLALGWWRTGADGWIWPRWVEPTGGIAAIALAAAFALFAWRKARRANTGARAADKLRRYASLWVPLYHCAWLVGQGHVAGGTVMATLAAVGFIGLSALREAQGYLEHPPGYRV